MKTTIAKEPIRPILRRLMETNLEKQPGYGHDAYCDSAKEKILSACGCPEGDVYFLVGGTQTNATVIASLLHRYEGVIAAATGHIAAHEAGAIEFTGHKVLTLPQHDGKLDAGEVEQYLVDYYHDGSYDHMVFPGMVYISHPTEYGTLYSLRSWKPCPTFAPGIICRCFWTGPGWAMGWSVPERT